MDDELPRSKLAQPALFDFSETSTDAVELFPAVWSGVEALSAPEAEVRYAALDRLLDLGAPRISPLVAYQVFTRLTDPDIRVRARVVRTLGQILTKDDQGNIAPDAVKRHLTAQLAQMRTRPIYASLETAEYDPSLEDHIAQIINACPYAGIHMANILSDRKTPMPIRRQAARMIGIVGFLDAIPILDRLEARLQTRLNGQQAMPFAPPSGPDETDLLPVIHATLDILRSR